MKLAEATEKVKVINERLISAKTKREGESTPAEAAGEEQTPAEAAGEEQTPAEAAGEEQTPAEAEGAEEAAVAGAAVEGAAAAAGAAVCLENGDGGAEHPEEALLSGGQEVRPAEEPSEETPAGGAVNGHLEEPSDPRGPGHEEAEGAEVELLHGTMNGGPDVQMSEQDDTAHKETETGETARTSEGMLNGGEEVKETNGVNGVHDNDDDDDNDEEEDTDLSGLEKKKEHLVEVNAKSTKANGAAVSAVILVNGGAENGVVVNGAPEE